jgi:transposase
MANLLKMAVIETILTLHRRGWSQRRIARELDIDRETVARYLRQASPTDAPTAAAAQAPAPSKPANAPTGSALPQEPSKPANAPSGSTAEVVESTPALAPSDCPGAASSAPTTATSAGHRPANGRPSDCKPWRSVIQAKLALGLSAQRIYQDLTTEHGCTASYYSVRRFVQRLQPATAELPFRRLECDPGEEAQVDFGTGAPVVTPDGQRRRTHVFRIVLSYSRKAYSEAVYRQTTDDFLRCLENAFAHFGGVPRILVPDNLKAAVLQPDWFDPEINPQLRAFATHYGLAILPTRPATPRHKGKVEKGVGYVQGNGLKGHVFPSLEAQNAHLLTWETTVADTRIHGTTRQQVSRLFEQGERPALQPLPAARFPCFHEGRRIVHRDGHVEVARAYYSVPPEYLARRVWVRWDGRLVRIFNERLEPIAVHVQHEPGRFSTQTEHIATAKISGTERGAAWLLTQIARIGTQAAGWAEAVIRVRGIEGVRVLQGLLSLSHRHPLASIDRACAVAHSRSEYRLRTIRALIDRDVPKQEALPFLEEHPLIRSLADYAQIVHDALRKEH